MLAVPQKTSSSENPPEIETQGLPIVTIAIMQYEYMVINCQNLSNWPTSILKTLICVKLITNFWSQPNHRTRVTSCARSSSCWSMSSNFCFMNYLLKIWTRMLKDMRSRRKIMVHGCSVKTEILRSACTEQDPTNCTTTSMVMCRGEPGWVQMRPSKSRKLLLTLM